MKGGGIVFLVIFIFFFICFVWGIASVVGNTRDAIQSKRTALKTDDSHIPKSSLTAESIPDSSSSEVTSSSTTSPKYDNYQAMEFILEYFQKIFKLHQQGVLTDEEFAKIKLKLIQNI